ncbi:VOC family protein [Streptomyces sp. NPDC102384]|uniref:VOC family protein n=1 Tax=unclassified Streptomyces TaxID=2593676 RepID=UPI0037F3DDA4
MRRRIGHVTLTVTDVDRSVNFYGALLDLPFVHAGRDEVGQFAVIGDAELRIGFRRHSQTSRHERFDPTRIGLDRPALHVDGGGALQAWQRRLDELQAPHSGIVSDAWGWHLTASDPDEIAVEFYAPRQAQLDAERDSGQLNR